MATKKAASRRLKAVPSQDQPAPAKARAEPVNLPSDLIEPVETAAQRARQAYAMTRVLEGYFISEFAKAAPIPNEALREYCDLLGSLLYPVGELLNGLVRNDSFPFWYRFEKEG